MEYISTTELERRKEGWVEETEAGCHHRVKAAKGRPRRRGGGRGVGDEERARARRHRSSPFSLTRRCLFEWNGDSRRRGLHFSGVAAFPKAKLENKFFWDWEERSRGVDNGHALRA